MALSSVSVFSMRSNPTVLPHNNLKASYDHIHNTNKPIKNSYFPLKHSIENLNFQLLDLYGQNRCLKSSSIGNQRQSSIRASDQLGSAAGSDPPLLIKASDSGHACWTFLRPHTIKGTILGSIALFARGLYENPSLFRWSLMFKAFFALLVLICGHGCIVGINQIYDIDLDRVNKPYLPIPAGNLSVKSAWFLVILDALAGLLIVYLNSGPFLTSLYCFSIILGSLYSAPPFRLKRSPIAALLCIATVRGFILNFGVYYATRAAFGLAFEWRWVKNFTDAFNRNFMLPIHAILASSLIFKTWELDQTTYAKAFESTNMPSDDKLESMDLEFGLPILVEILSLSTRRLFSERRGSGERVERPPRG
ncbi:Prenyltransferase [Trema orientale]|uniref:Prenyltransferase n=1 Tax=Trema orientale TaxID=63057 RepID=A0A2P5EA89_TREOI|nr:Prenyltransferase [Trema orientale]